MAENNTTLYTGFLGFNSNFKITKPAPIDDRLVVNSRADLAGIHDAYEGLAVTVLGEQTIYILVSKNNSSVASDWTWQKVSGQAELSSEELAAIKASQDLVDNGTLTLATVVSGFEETQQYRLNLSTLVSTSGALEIGTSGEDKDRLVLNTSKLIVDNGGLEISDNKIQVKTGDGVEINDGKVQVALSEPATDDNTPGLGFDANGKLKINWNLMYDQLGEITE